MQHATTHGNLDQRLTAAGQPLMIAAEPTPAHHPGEGSLDDPSSGQGAKATGEELLPVNLLALVDQQPPLGNRERFDGLNGPPQSDLGPGTEGATVVAVSPDQREPGKHLLQRLQQATASFLIGCLGSCHFDLQQVALGINKRVALAAPDFFSPCRSPFWDHERHWF